ncbi:MAG TPA: hypothetical protein VF215_17170 [Thermoanaerobaculia bacterium]
MVRFRALAFFAFVISTEVVCSAPTAPAKSSWSLTTDERIAARLDPAKVTQRLQVFARRASVHPSRATISSSSVSASARFVIEGSADPELFMPWELAERFLNTIDSGAADAEASRQRYTDDIVASGWSIASFWTDLDRITTDYFALRHEIGQLSNRKPRADDWCVVRVRVLERARKKFGREAFDRFLYTAVAPNVTVFSDDPMTAEQLLRLTEGCR